MWLYRAKWGRLSMCEKEEARELFRVESEEERVNESSREVSHKGQKSQ